MTARYRSATTPDAAHHQGRFLTRLQPESRHLMRKKPLPSKTWDSLSFSDHEDCMQFFAVMGAGNGGDALNGDLPAT